VILQTENLTKHYGKTVGVEDVNLGVEAGEVFGFLGPNGAGKTTTIRLLLDLLRPTRGRALLFGKHVRAAGHTLRRRVGYLPGDLGLYQDMTARSYLDFVARLRKTDCRGRRDEIAERLQMNLSQKIKAASRGMRQKVGIIAAMMHEPALLILDEPTAGLDPLMQRSFYDLLAGARQLGQTIFMSSHNLPEVQKTCQRVAIIRDGKLVAVEAISDLTRRALRRVVLTFAQPAQREWFEKLDAHKLQVDGHRATLLLAGASVPVLRAALGRDLVDAEILPAELEDVFLEYYDRPNSTGEHRP
jgi:ABC-2 type transport system ATP-binding protein